MELPKRKPTRIKEYDYSTAGAYFVTVCTKDRKQILSSIVGEGLRALPCVQLSPIGCEVARSIEFLEKKYKNITISKSVIMPNHIHLIVEILPVSSGGRGDPPLQKIIAELKSFTTHKYGGDLWQRSFHDHIIRNEKDYKEIAEYIENNPARWAEDCFHPNHSTK